MKPVNEDMENARNLSLTGAFDALARKDPAAARAAVANPHLTGEWRKHLLSRLESAGPSQ